MWILHTGTKREKDYKQVKMNLRTNTVHNYKTQMHSITVPRWNHKTKHSGIQCMASV